MKTKKVLLNLAKCLTLVSIVILVNYLCRLEDLYQIIDEKIIPILVGLAGAIASIFSLLKPIFSKLDTSINIDLKEKLAKLAILIQENNQLNENYKKECKAVEELEKDLKILIEMTKLALSQDENLVKNGIANQICKVGDKDEIT